jgi:hypothetical protein
MPADLERDLDSIERWFVTRGVPHFIERRDSIWDIWGRAIPLLVPAYVLLGLNALNLQEWSVLANIGVAALVVAGLVATWMLSNRARGRRAAQIPQDVGPIELAILLVVPALPSAVLGQWGDVLQTVVQGVILLAVVRLATSYGVVPLFGWAIERGFGQLVVFFNVVVRALPLLLMFTTFLFINAEVWQVAGTLAGPIYVVVLATFVALGTLFLLSKLPRLLAGLDHFDTWDEIADHADVGAARSTLGAIGQPDRTPGPSDLTLRQRFNAGLVALFPQAVQITLSALTVTAFFVLFGFLAIPVATAASWTQTESVHTFATWHVGGRDLALTEPLLRVAAFLGAFTGMYFTVVLSTDATYREEFVEDIGPELRQSLAVRRVYRAALAQE